MAPGNSTTKSAAWSGWWWGDISWKFSATGILWRVLTVWWHPTAPCASSGKCTSQPNHRIRGVKDRKGLSDHRAHAPDSECCRSCSSTQISNWDHNWCQLKGQRELDALSHFVLVWFSNLVFSMVQKDLLLCGSGWKAKPNTWVWLLCCPDWWWVWGWSNSLFPLFPESESWWTLIKWAFSPHPNKSYGFCLFWFWFFFSERVFIECRQKSIPTQAREKNPITPRTVKSVAQKSQWSKSSTLIALGKKYLPNCVVSFWHLLCWCLGHSRGMGRQPCWWTPQWQGQASEGTMFGPRAKQEGSERSRSGKALLVLEEWIRGWAVLWARDGSWEEEIIAGKGVGSQGVWLWL